MIIIIESIFTEGLTTNEYYAARILMALLFMDMALTFPYSVFNF